MSLIFDALRRAESDYLGKNDTISANAAELLKRAEHQARAQRSAETRVNGSEVSDPFGHERRNCIQECLPNDDPSKDFVPGSVVLEPAALTDFQTVHLSCPFDDQLVVLADKESPATEAFRLLGLRLRHIRRERAIQTLLVCSTATQEGKSVISANLACTIAATTQQNVLLIEGDIRRPSLGHLFHLDPHPGLSEYLRCEHPLSESIYQLQEAGLWFMPAGTSPDSHAELIQSPSLVPTIHQLAELFPSIIIDSPPVLPLADTSVWARLADSILLVVRNGSTQKRKLQRGLEALDEDKLIGAVINSATTSTEEDYYYYRDHSTSSRSATNVSGSPH